eukprot:6052010-Prymnesium_polylepis.2
MYSRLRTPREHASGKMCAVRHTHTRAAATCAVGAHQVRAVRERRVRVRCSAVRWYRWCGAQVRESQRRGAAAATNRAAARTRRAGLAPAAEASDAAALDEVAKRYTEGPLVVGTAEGGARHLGQLRAPRGEQLRRARRAPERQRPVVRVELTGARGPIEAAAQRARATRLQALGRLVTDRKVERVAPVLAAGARERVRVERERELERAVGERTQPRHPEDARRAAALAQHDVESRGCCRPDVQVARERDRQAWIERARRARALRSLGKIAMRRVS